MTESQTTIEKYEKMDEYIEAIFDIFKTINKTAKKKSDTKLGLISLVIYNYTKKLAEINKINLNYDKDVDKINLVPVFEYMNYKKIELYDFQQISENDINTENQDDIERFVLTHIYYITQ
jgi:hypothetical protein